MAKILDVLYEGSKCYEIKLTDTFDGLASEIVNLGINSTRKICIVTDSNVAPIYLEKVSAELKKSYTNCFSFCFEAGESSKNISTVEKLYQYLIENKFDRNDILVALGGGVVGDLTGFTAATYLRGIAFIQIPTTLLSQVDSSIGGKTGVDFMCYKNMVGAFYQPKLVYMNLNVLRTLPKEQLISGLGEVLKHGLIRNAEYFKWLKDNRDAIFALEPSAVEHMVYESCLVKRDVVQRDPKEKGERALLNFGHTIGHAVEKLSDFKLFHGQCVGIGMVAASYMSFKKGHIAEDTYNDIIHTLEAFGMPLVCGNDDVNAIYEATRSDKKMDGNTIKFILLRSVGDAFITTELTPDEIRDGINKISIA